MVNHSAIAGVAGVVMMVAAAGSSPAMAQGACPAGCDGATNWTGFWLGAGFGGNAGMIEHDYVVTDDATGNYVNSGNDSYRGASGFIGTVGLGYDWHVRDRFVLGAFTDFDFGTSEHKESDRWGIGGGSYKTAGWKMEQNSTWSIGARIGLLTSNTSMFYGLIGYARTDMDVSVFTEIDGVSIPGRPVSKNIDFSGLVLGAGLEHNLGNGFFLKGEYRYTNYGSESFGPVMELDNAGNPLSPSRSETDTFDLDSHSVRLTLAYKFGRSPEVVEEVSYKDIPPAPSYTRPYK